MFGYTKERNTAAAATYLGDLGGNDSSECLRETPCSRLTESGNAARLHCVHSSMEQAAGGSRGGT
ncbi:uncharacterized protein LOC144136683 isoform X5 [Amblyomma americanum]